MPRRKDDILLKSAFEEAFPDLLRFCFENADEVFDCQKGFQFLDKELNELFPEINNPGGSRFVDMLAKVNLKNGTEEWVLVHVEIQGSNDRRFAERMLQYWYRIYDRYQVNITAIAVFTGNEKQNRPTKFHKHFLGTEILYKYNVYHILDHKETELLRMDNPFALVVLAAQKVLLRGKLTEEELNNQRLLIAKALIQSKKYDHEKIARFLYFIKQFVYIEDSRINLNFDREIDTLTGKPNTMGIIETIKMLEREKAFEKGIEKGIEKKAKELVINLLNSGDFSISQISNYANVPEDYVLQVKAELK